LKIQKEVLKSDGVPSMLRVLPGSPGLWAGSSQAAEAFRAGSAFAPRMKEGRMDSTMEDQGSCPSLAEPRGLGRAGVEEGEGGDGLRAGNPARKLPPFVFQS
jgi:hypothetical protein